MPIPFSVVTHWALADLVEVRLLFGSDRSISIARLFDEQFEEASLADLALYDEAENDDSDQFDEAGFRRNLRQLLVEGTSEESLLAEETIGEIERRAIFIGEFYPIDVSAGVARLHGTSWRDNPAYAFLVALNARYLWKMDANLNKAARLFERLVVPALRQYWGGEAAHFGWPRDTEDHGTFQSAFPRLLSRMRERLNVSPQELPVAQKDLQVDAVAWRPLDDRPGQTVLLCQCSIGDDWSDKGVPIEKWNTLVNFAVTPTRGLAFPFLPEVAKALSEIDWLLLCAGVGVPLDRLRLARLLSEAEIDPQLLAQLVGWVEPMVPNLAAL